jgi:hypothetical protein
MVSARLTPQFDDELPMAIAGKWGKNNIALLGVSGKP